LKKAKVNYSDDFKRYVEKKRTASLSASGSLLVCVHLQLLEGALERDAREDQQAAVFGALEAVVANFWQNFGKMLLVFGCIGTDFCKKIGVLQHFSKSTRLSS